MAGAVKRRDLEGKLAGIPRLAAPRPEWEQYRTPDAVAADLLLAAHKDGAIAGKSVLDLGSGTGVLAIGAALLGATLATGVEVDPESVLEAQRSASAAGVTASTWFITADVAAWHPDPAGFDTVVMNPPFGAQAANRHADRVFLERAVESVRPRKGTVWALAQERTARFLTAYARELGVSVEQVAAWDYPLEATMPHHREQARLVRVAAYRFAFP